MTEPLILGRDRLRVRRVAGAISTDDIIPARYKHMYTDPVQLAKHLFEGRFPGFRATLTAGDAIVSQDIFGIGSSREQAVSALSASGVGAVIAPEFGRIFFRNAWNLGIPAIQVDVDLFNEGQLIGIDLARGRFLGAPGLPTFSPPPQRLLDMIAAGGLLELIKRRVTPVAR